ncbi:MAG: hypothetical protein VKQ33_01205 [Candidatus Sericytochromatia bacterium]|nr:hypothetical protein [Candidatus Sericytochromatia bacterium]
MSENLIEHARVPELEVLALQQQLNARVRAGLLSGPLLAETGKLDEATTTKQREQEAMDLIALAAIAPQRPADPALHASAQADDEAILDRARAELGHIPDPPSPDQDPKAPSLARVQALARLFHRKWEPGGQAVERLEALLAEAVAPGSLLLADGAFAWPALEAALARLKQAEEVLPQVPADEPERPALVARLIEARARLVAGLHPGAASRPRKPAPTLEAPTVALPAARPRSAPLPAIAAAAPAGAPEPAPRPAGFTPDPERDRRGRELDILGPERRGALLREATARSPADPEVGPLAASLVRTHPEAATPGLIAQLDAYACHELSRDEARLQRVPGAARVGLLKVLGERGGDAAEALLAATAASLLRQHPHAASEVLQSLPDPRRGALSATLVARLGDDDVLQLPRDLLHQLARQLQAAASAEERRQLARLVRLLGRR